MNKTLNLRRTIIDVLDDPHGINETGYLGIVAICKENGWQDILDKIDGAESDLDSSESRFWLDEDDAMNLRGITV